MFTATARITTLNAKAIKPCSSTSLRITGLSVVTSLTCEVMPTVKAK